ncbi:MAG: 50S ribosomal protein L9 [Endomicrobium sp.]|nr:50S ribosomal protein L9 [Endomicrobium sp.]
MKVVLKSSIANLGQCGEIKEVSDGFARNYLIPKNIAVKADVQNIKIWEKKKIGLKKQNDEMVASAKKIASEMEASEFVVKVKVGENQKFFGSVNNVVIADACENKGFKINKRDIMLYKNIKRIGNYVIGVRLHHNVIAKIKLSIVGE